MPGTGTGRLVPLSDAPVGGSASCTQVPKAPRCPPGGPNLASVRSESPVRLVATRPKCQWDCHSRSPVTRNRAVSALRGDNNNNNGIATLESSYARNKRHGAAAGSHECQNVPLALSACAAPLSTCPPRCQGPLRERRSFSHAAPRHIQYFGLDRLAQGLKEWPLCCKHALLVLLGKNGRYQL